jgi:hypothetical protein
MNILIPAVGTLHIRNGLASVHFLDHLKFDTRVAIYYIIFVNIENKKRPS